MKRKLALMLVVSLILSLGAFSTVSFAADNGEITITTGAEFKEKVIVDNFGSTFIIQNDIVLPEDYVSIEGFYGTLKGAEDGKKNIQINKPLFASFKGNTTIENINLKTDEGVTLTSSVQDYGALVCSISGNYNYVIDKVANYCALSSSKYYVGGLIGYISEGNVTVSNCSNYADIVTTGRYAAGIIGRAVVEEGLILELNVTKSFNAGDISAQRAACGIIGLADKNNKSNAISHCFNVGNLTVSTNNAAAGVAGIAITNGTRGMTVNYCYNIGTLTGTAATAIARVAASGYVKDSTGCYYVGSRASNENPTIGKERTIEQLASGLNRLGFDSEVWEYTDTTGTNKYSLPQIIGNPFETDKTTWYVAPVETLSIADAKSFTTSDGLYEDGLEEGEAAITDYAIVVTKFELPSGTEDFAYGILLSEKELSDANFTKDNTSVIKVEAKKEFYVAFGIMFYGNKFVNGNTYYARPYIEIDGEYTYGAQTPFVFGAE